MFTGLIEAVGTVQATVPSGSTRRFVIEAPFASDLAIGESVAIDGTCCTVVAREQKTFAVEAIAETLKRTKLGTYRVGQSVNLERALCLSDRLGGHVVQGHVDCTGKVGSIRESSTERILSVDFPGDYAALLVDKGSVAIDGVSLTVVNASARKFTVALIPHTWEATNLALLRAGDPVNLEFDLLGKYMLRIKQLGHGVEQSAGAGEGELRA
jgi:riboflavin synthase